MIKVFDDDNDDDGEQGEGRNRKPLTRERWTDTNYFSETASPTIPGRHLANRQ